MEKLIYSDLLLPVIEEIGKDIDNDNRPFDEPSNVLLVIGGQVRADKGDNLEITYTALGNNTMLGYLIKEQMQDDPDLAEILQTAVDIYRRGSIFVEN